MIVAPLLVCLGLGAAGAEPQVIDAFSYPDAAAARAAWKPSRGTPPVDVAQEDGRRIVTLRVPFASDGKLPRTSIDRSGKLDLAVPGELALDVALDPPAAGGAVNVYFHSGGGWYSANAPLRKPGWQTLRFSKAAFHTEDQPAGWDHVDTIRISVWRSQAKDAVLRLRQLTAVAHDVALVIPSPSKHVPEGEMKTAHECSQRVAAMLGELGLGSDAVDEAAVAQGALGRRQVAILAYAPRLSEAAVAGLEQFVARGGRLIVCYQIPPRLAKLLGIGRISWMRADPPGLFAEMRFDGPGAAAIAGLPASARQTSWNVNIAEPAGPRSQVIGWWYDEQGRATGKAAAIAGPNGVFLSHVILADDPEAKRQLLAALVGHYSPALWQAMAQAAIGRANQVGPLEELAPAAALIEKSGVPEAQKCLAAARAADVQARSALDQKKYAEVIPLAKQAQQQLSEAYLRAQPSTAREGRGVWNHSGTGAYPGDWERSAKELAAAGFNQIFPNMLWGGLAHYASDVLPRSAVYEKYGDQIAQCLAAAKRHGLEVHVWKVNWNLSTAPREFVEKLRRENRTLVSSQGKPADWLCPSNPQNFELERDAMLEVARKYAVDGLHFDYIRYPGPEFCYCDGCRQRFESESGRAVANWPKDCTSGGRQVEYADWRCRQITRLVGAVARGARQIRPGIKISAAVFSGYPECRRSVAQDWPLWARLGYVDFLCPMDYTESDLTFAGLVENQLRLVEGKIPLYPGIGATASSSTLPADRVAAQVEVARRLEAGGFTIFNFQESTAAAVIPGLGLGVGAQRAVPPHRGR